MVKQVSKDPLPGDRYERKFFIAELCADEVEMLVKLHPAMFLVMYPPRFVNTLYLDSVTMKSYFDNVAGVSDRVKVRIRWYGDLFGQVEPHLELKIKNGSVGRKELYPLTPFTLTQRFSWETIHQVLKSSQIPETLKLDLMGLECVLLIRYYRKYFQSACRNYRITLDKGLEFSWLAAGSNLLNKLVDPVHTVLELKYEHDKDDRADRIANYFPFRIGRVSKYVAGVEGLNLW